MPTPSQQGVSPEDDAGKTPNIPGVATSITAFIGPTLKGPVNEPVPIAGTGDFEREFGGLWSASPMSYAVHQYFANGGQEALIVRLTRQTAAARVALPTYGAEPLTLVAANPGAWGNQLIAHVDYEGIDADNTTAFNLVIEELDGDGNPQATESYYNLSLDPGAGGRN